MLESGYPAGAPLADQPGLLWLHAVADLVTTLAYYSIPVVLIRYARKRRDADSRKVAYVLAAFLLAAGTARLFSVWNLWNSAYLLAGLVKALAAALAVAAAVVLVRLVPRASELPSFRDLLGLNEILRHEVRAGTEAEARLRGLLEGEREAGEARLQAFFEVAPLAILAINTDQNLILVNRQTEEMFGYARDELLGQPLVTLIPERFREKHPENVRNYFENPRRRKMGTALCLVGRRRDGSEFPVEVGLNYVETGEGRFALAMVSDIAERKHHEEELQRVNEQLRRSNEELENFTYAASHDLQEPLRMVTNYMQLLERRAGDKLDGDAREFLSFAVEGGRRMRDLIQDLLRLSRIGTQKLELSMVPAQTIVDQATLSLRSAIEDSGAAITAGELPPVVADSGLIAQVFQNLLANAIKFRAPGTRPEIHISARSEDAMRVFAVRDNGIGIDMAHAGRIFQMFERLHSPEDYGGSGVGLALARRIIERHGGRIWVESSPGQGSTFYFSLPAKMSLPMAASG